MSKINSPKRHNLAVLKSWETVFLFVHRIARDVFFFRVGMGGALTCTRTTCVWLCTSDLGGTRSQRVTTLPTRLCILPQVDDVCLDQDFEGGLWGWLGSEFNNLGINNLGQLRVIAKIWALAL